MKKIETRLENVLEDITAFYDASAWHFITLNGIDLGGGEIELQWIFSRYGVKDEIVAYYVRCGYESPVPSLVPLIPSAIMGEREVVDMFGVAIEGTAGSIVP